MQVAATLKHARISAQKARLIADMIRGLPAERALEVLIFNSKKAAKIVKKVVDSAIANAEHNNGADVDELKIATVFVGEAPSAKRFSARARGRGDRITKRSCHITVAVSDGKAGE